MNVRADMDEAGLTAELVFALDLDRPEHTAHVLAMLAGSVATEARCHRSLTPETAATLLALNELQHALSGRPVAILTYQGVDLFRELHPRAVRSGARTRLRRRVAAGGLRRGHGTDRVEASGPGRLPRVNRQARGRATPGG